MIIYACKDTLFPDVLLQVEKDFIHVVLREFEQREKILKFKNLVWDLEQILDHKEKIKWLK